MREGDTRCSAPEDPSRAEEVHGSRVHGSREEDRESGEAGESKDDGGEAKAEAKW